MVDKSKYKNPNYHHDYYIKNKEHIRKCGKERQHEYYLKNKEKIKEYHRQYNNENEEKVKERQKKYQEKNKEHIRQQRKEYAITHKDIIKERRKTYRKLHEDEIKEKYKKYSLENRDKLNKRSTEYRKNHPDRRKNTQLKCNFGITLDDYKKIFDKQNGKCAICGISRNETDKDFAVDHDHISGEVRGLLCIDCNRMLGSAKDNIDVLLKAAEYLKTYDRK